MVKLYSERVKRGIGVSIAGDRFWAVVDEDWERDYVDFACYCFENGYYKAVLKESDREYVFLVREEDEVPSFRLMRKTFSDPDEAEGELDIFFAGSSFLVFSPDDIPSYRVFPLKALLTAGVVVLAGGYLVYEIFVVPPEEPVPKVVAPIVEKVYALTDAERKYIKVVAFREYTKDLELRIDFVRSTAYSRLAGVFFNWADRDTSVTVSGLYTFEFLYPVPGGVFAGEEDGNKVWKKEVPYEKTYTKNDVRGFRYASFDRCGEAFLEMGALVQERRKDLVKFRIDMEASKFADALEVFRSCYVYPENFSITGGRVLGTFVLFRR